MDLSSESKKADNLWTPAVDNVNQSGQSDWCRIERSVSTGVIVDGGLKSRAVPTNGSSDHIEILTEYQ